MRSMDTKASIFDHSWILLFTAWLFALAATLGALFIGEILGQEPCLLCWYQRVAMFPLVLILGVACYINDASVGRYAIPLTGLGGSLALWHTLLYAELLPVAIEPCRQGTPCTGTGMTLFGTVPLPLLSLATFGVITLLLWCANAKGER